MRFREKNAAEQGFARIWDAKIAPHLRKHRARFVATRRYALLGIGLYILVGLPASYYFLMPYWVDPKLGLPVQLGFLAISALWLFLACYAHWSEARVFDRFMRESVAQQFAPIFKRDNHHAQPLYIASMLQDEGMGRRGNPSISNYHVGHYRDCQLSFFNVCFTHRYYRTRGQRQTKRHYFLVVEIGVPVAFIGKVYIKRDYGFLINWARGQWLRMRRYKIRHDDFEDKFEIYADQAESAKRLITRSFCVNLLAIERMYPKQFGLFPRPVTGMFRDGRFYLIVSGVRDIMTDGIAYSHPDKAQQTARRMIARLALLPRIVDYLHGVR